MAAYAEEGALDGGAIILIPQEDGQPMLLGEALMGGGSQLVLGQLQPLQIEGAASPLVFAPVGSSEVAGPLVSTPAITDPPQEEEEALTRPETGESAVPLLRTVTQTLKVRWLDELLAHKAISCPIRDCPFTCAAITAMEKHYSQCAGVNGSGLDRCPYCDAQFLTHSSALHVHIVEEHPTRRSLMQSHVGEGRCRRSMTRRGRAPVPVPAKTSLARPTGGQPQQQSQAGSQWDWEQRRRTYSRSWGEPMGPTSELFRRPGSEEEDPLQLPRSVINRSEITLSSEELALDEHQLQQEGTESVEGCQPAVETPTPETIRLEPMQPVRTSRGRGCSSRRPPRSRNRGDNVRTMQVIVKNASGAESTNALLRNPRVLQTLGDLAVNAATTGAAATITLATGSPPSQAEDEDEAEQAVVAVHSATASDGRYLQVERALKAPTLQPAEVDRFFGRRVDCSCQTDDLPPVPPVRPELPPSGVIAPPAILKRNRLLAPPQAKVPGKPLAVSIVCSSRASSSDEEDDGDTKTRVKKPQRLVSSTMPRHTVPAQVEHPVASESTAEHTDHLVQQHFVRTAHREPPQVQPPPYRLSAPLEERVVHLSDSAEPVAVSVEREVVQEVPLGEPVVQAVDDAEEKLNQSSADTSIEQQGPLGNTATEQSMEGVQCEAPPMPAPENSTFAVKDQQDNVTVECDAEDKDSLLVGKVASSQEGLQEQSCEAAPACSSVVCSEGLPEAVPAQPGLIEHRQVQQESQRYCEELCDLHSCSSVSQELAFGQNVLVEPERHEGQSQGSYDLQEPDSSPEQVVPQHDITQREGTREETLAACEPRGMQSSLVEAGMLQCEERSASPVEQSSEPSVAPLLEADGRDAVTVVEGSAQDGNTSVVSGRSHRAHVLVPSLDTVAETSCGQDEGQGALHLEELSSHVRTPHQACLPLSMPEGVPCQKMPSPAHEACKLQPDQGMPEHSSIPSGSEPLSPAAKKFKVCQEDVVPCSRNDSDAFMDDADSASSCEALHIVESVPEEEVRSVAGTGESQVDTAGHFLVVSGGRRVAASSCAQIPVQLVVSRGMQQLKRLACSVTCRTLDRSHRPTLQFMIELKLGSRLSPLRPLLKAWSRITGRPAVRRQRPRRFQLRFKPTALPQQLRPPVIGLQREEPGHPSDQVLEEEVPAGSSGAPSGPHLESPTGDAAGHRLKPTKRRRLVEGASEAEDPRKRGRPRNIDNSQGDSFRCSACGQLFSCRKEASHHVLHAHYNLARLNDERPFSEQEVRAALRRAAESLDQLVCGGCGEAFKTYMSFYVHRSRCTSTKACTNDDRPPSTPEAVAALKQVEGKLQPLYHPQPGRSRHASSAATNRGQQQQKQPREQTATAKACTPEAVDALNQTQDKPLDGPQPGCSSRAASGATNRGQLKQHRERPKVSPCKPDGTTDAGCPKRVKRVPCFKLNLDFPDGTALVCSSCQESFVCKETVTKHVLTAHYNLARVNDERPLSLEEMRSALRLASFSTSRFVCPERGCNANFASYMSYYTHLSSCGPFVKAFVSQHPAQPPSLDDAPGTPKERKRTSALRALASFRDLEGGIENAVTATQASKDSDFAPSDAEEEQDCDSWDDDSILSGEDRPAVDTPLVILQRAWCGRYEAPQQPSDHIDPKLVAGWTVALARRAYIQCPNEGCIKKFSTVPGLQYHFRRCGLMQLYRCLNCSEATFARPKSLLEHLRACYTERPEGDQRRRFLESPCTHRRSLISSLRLPAQSSSALGPMFRHMFQHMQRLQKRCQCWKETLYPSWMPSCWQLLDQHDREPYLPRFRESPALRAQAQEWQRLPLFGCLSSGGSHETFYPGGAIWAAAWCPLPPDQQEDPHEWVVLSCCPDPDREHPLTKAEPEPGLLQIWDLGPLRLNRDPHGAPPRLALCLAHDFGFIAGLDWCPSGCHQRRSRLGLLALACGDGCARIISIPDPDSLQPTAEAPMYTVESDLRLCIPPGPLGAVPCTRVAWDVARKHQHIAVGFADGRVAVFRLVPVVGTEEPLWVWQAHQGAIMGLGWTLQGHVCTAAIDHAARVWDMRRPGLVPVSAMVRGPARQVSLSPHWNGLFVVGEESPVGGPAHAVFRENGYYGFTPKTLVSHSATVWGVTVSPWSNLAASCDASGKVAAILLPYLSSNLDFVKHHIKMRLPLFQALVVPLAEGEQQQLKGPAHQGGHSLARQLYGISFEDTDLEQESAFDQPAQEHRAKNDSCGQYHLNSFNTVCWSPNRGSANWLFSAGQAGVARLTWLGLYGRHLEDAAS